jgi:hypothetical protein
LYSSKQKENQQPFEQQLPYISACVLFVGQQGLNIKLQQCELLRCFWQQCEGDFISSEM